MIFFSLSNRPCLAYSSFWAPLGYDPFPWCENIFYKCRTVLNVLPGFYPLCPHFFWDMFQNIFFFLQYNFCRERLLCLKPDFKGRGKFFQELRKHSITYFFGTVSTFISLEILQKLRPYCIHFQIIENKLKKKWLEEKIHFAENSFLKLLGHMNLFICLKRELANFIFKRAI